MRIENFTQDGTATGPTHVANFALQVDGTWARSSAPHLLILADYDARDELIGLTFAGPLAQIAVTSGLPAALKAAVSPKLREAIGQRSDGSPGIDDVEIEQITKAAQQATGPIVAELAAA